MTEPRLTYTEDEWIIRVPKGEESSCSPFADFSWLRTAFSTPEPPCPRCTEISEVMNAYRPLFGTHVTGDAKVSTLKPPKVRCRHCGKRIQQSENGWWNRVKEPRKDFASCYAFQPPEKHEPQP